MQGHHEGVSDVLQRNGLGDNPFSNSALRHAALFQQLQRIHPARPLLLDQHHGAKATLAKPE